MRQPLDSFEDMPKGMRKYLSYNGWHFNKELCDYATSLMISKGSKIKALDKKDVDTLLANHNVKLNNNVGYDYVYVANMCLADFAGRSIIDDEHAALFIKDVIDDEDAPDGTTMRRWYATMVGKGIMIDWHDVL
jgi:hypothetical protein